MRRLRGKALARIARGLGVPVVRLLDLHDEGSPNPAISGGQWTTGPSPRCLSGKALVCCGPQTYTSNWLHVAPGSWLESCDVVHVAEVRSPRMSTIDVLQTPTLGIRDGYCTKLGRHEP